MMTHLISALALVSLLCGLLLSEPVAARDISLRSFNAKRHEAVKRWDPSTRRQNRAGDTRRDTDGPAPPRVKNITFTNPEASSMSATVYTCPVSSLIPFQNSMSTARQFLLSTLMLAHPGRA
jgi:hypothetical protein